MIQKEPIPDGFKIGSASKIAGISPNTLRTWIRRGYFSPSVVSPSGERLLSSDDLRRVKNLKTLVDLGDSIGRIAHLENDSLESRIDELHHIRAQDASSGSVRSMPGITAAIVSPASSSRISSLKAILDSVFRYQSLDDLRSAIDSGESFDLIAIDFRGEMDDHDVRISELANTIETPVVVVYDFLTRHALQNLTLSKTHLIRWPVNSLILERFIQSVLLDEGRHVGWDDESSSEIPPKKFDEELLTQLSDSRPELKCECPRHISTLVASLGAFEDYCARCENDSPADEAMHRSLRAKTAEARRIMETALVRLCEYDGIPLDFK